MKKHTGPKQYPTTLKGSAFKRYSHDKNLSLSKNYLSSFTNQHKPLHGEYIVNVSPSTCLISLKVKSNISIFSSPANVFGFRCVIMLCDKFSECSWLRTSNAHLSSLYMTGHYEPIVSMVWKEMNPCQLIWLFWLHRSYRCITCCNPRNNPSVMLHISFYDKSTNFRIK